jgi:2-octaprenyl-6-methoxyphenol hydroxylase
MAARTTATDRIETRVLIAGGGMVGLTLGIALSRAGIGTVVVDGLDPAKVVDARFDGRVSAVAFASCRMMEALGLWPHLAPHAQPINDILVSDGRAMQALDRGAAAPFFLHFDHRELGRGPLGHLVENRHIRLAQQAVMGEMPGLTLIAPAMVAQMKAGSGSVTASLSTGETVRAALCLAADGRRSRLREQAGIKTVAWRYGQTGIVTTVEHERPHEGVAQEYFLPNGPFAILPMVGNRSSLVWTEPDEVAPDYLNMDEDAFAGAVAARFGPYLGATRPVGPRWSYPLTLHLARAYVAERLALVGDAAHGIHPIAGQGLNLGLRDVAALAEVLTDAYRLGQDIGAADVLTRYQQWRRFDNVALAAATDILTRLFSNDIRPVALARSLGLGIVSRIGPARRLFMRHAGGALALGGEQSLPRLLRGEAL